MAPQRNIQRDIWRFKFIYNELFKMSGDCCNVFCIDLTLETCSVWKIIKQTTQRNWVFHCRCDGLWNNISRHFPDNVRPHLFAYSCGGSNDFLACKKCNRIWNCQRYSLFPPIEFLKETELRVIYYYDLFTCLLSVWQMRKFLSHFCGKKKTIIRIWF